MTSQTIRFDRISQHDRVAEPVTLGVPFARGALTDAAAFAVHDGGTALPCQVTTTSTWHDGSVRWLLARFLVDLPGNAAHEVSFACDGEPVAPPTPVRATESDEGVLLDTGPLRALVPRQGFDVLRWVELDGTRLLDEGACGDGFFVVDGAGRRVSTKQGGVGDVRLVESGPVCAVVEVTGSHGDDAGALLDFRVLVTAWAGKRSLEVEYQFVNREADAVTVSEIGWALRPGTTGSSRCARGEGYYRTTVSEGPGRKLLDQELIRFQAVEHVLECFYGDLWGAWGNDSRAVALTMFQAHQNFPKAVAVDEMGIAAEIFPQDQPAVEIARGIGKTHRFQLLFQPALDLPEIVARSLQFQLPDVAILPESVYRDAGVWPDLFPAQRCRAIDQALIDLADTRGRGLGMLHFGDAPDHGYTNQGRGGGRQVWTNNEYDVPHAMFLMFARTGERRFRDIALAAARHWVDVDVCHASDDPLRAGGMITHSAGHVTGSVTPSHQWTEGLLDTWHMVGWSDARAAAVSIADNVLRHLDAPKFQTAGAFAARETGWALHGLAAVYDETREAKYRDACDTIAGQFLDWKREHGAFLAPYTSHTTVRVPFMVAIAVNALWRYADLTGRDDIRDLVTEEVGDMVEHCLMPDGRFFYKQLPSLNRRLGSPREMEALAHAYEHSGQRRFLEVLFGMMAEWIARSNLSAAGSQPKVVDEDALLYTGPGPKGFAMGYPCLMAAYRVLSEAGVLGALEGPRPPDWGLETGPERASRAGR